MVNRLRDLRGGDRRLAIAVFALLLVPFVVALVRAFHDGWVPSGDEANIATRALDVFSRHPPLTGLPSTSGAYGQRIQANHPGPIEFYLLAVPVRVLGATTGPLLTAAAINAACCIVAIWVCFRRLGLAAMAGAATVLLAVMWSGGTAVLTDTLSSNMPMYSLLCTATLVWALMGGDVRLLPLAVVVGSYAAQQHLATGVLVGVLGLVAAVGLGRRLVADGARAGRAWWLAGFAVAVVCWTPVVYDEIAGHPGNLGQIVRFARDGTRQTVGIRAGLDQVLRVVSPPTVLGRTDTTGLFFLHAPGAFASAVGVLVIVALLAVAVGARARSRATAQLAIVALVVLVAGGFAGGNVPSGSESWRVNLYRWTWTGAFLTWTALGFGVALLLRAVAGSARADAAALRRARRFTPVALTVLASVIAASTVFVQGRDDHNRERRAFTAERAIGAAVLARVDRRHPVVVVAQGYAAAESIEANVIFRLVQAGVRVEVSSYLTAWYGRFREYRPSSGASAVVISSSGPRVPDVGGTVITRVRLSPERDALIDSLSAAAAGHPIALAPGAAAFIRHAFPEYPGFDALYARALAATSSISLHELLVRPIYEPVTLRLALAGMLRGPRLPRAAVERLLALAPDHDPVGNDTAVEVRLLTPAQLRAGARRAPLSALAVP